MDAATKSAMVPDASVERLFQARRGMPAVDYRHLSVEAARANFAAAQAATVLAASPAMVEIRDIESEWEGRHVELRLYRPLESDTAAPALVYFHGGGWVLGSLDSHDHICRMLASLAGTTVLSVSYPLSPETPFPGAVQSGLAAIRWIFTHATELGIDRDRIAVAGDSAGGNLAAVMALHSRNSALPPLKAQLLLYPLLDLEMSGPSYGNAHPELSVSPSAIGWYIGHYLGGRASASHWEASPLLADSLVGSCPAFILTAGCDVVCSDGIVFAERLRRAGVSVEEIHYPGQIHAFLALPHLLPEADQAYKDIANYLVHHVSGARGP